MNPPESLDAMTPQWLTTCLRAAGHLPHETVTRIIRHAPTGPLTSLSVMFAAAPPDAPAKLIFKAWPAEWVHIGGHELYFYTTLAPRMSFMRVPHLYSAHQSEAGAWALYEDFTVHYQIAEFKNLPPLNQTQQIVDDLARFHACWWDHPQLQEQQLLNVQGGPLCMSHLTTPDGLRAYDRRIRLQAPQLIAAFGDSMPAAWRHAFDWAIENWYRIVQDRAEQGNNLTLIHGDVHWHNLAFHRSSAERLYFDWETHKCGLGVFDLAYFLHDTYWQSARQEHELPLMQRYFDGLRQHGVPNYRWEQFEADYRLALVTLVIVHMQWKELGLRHSDRFIQDEITGFELWRNY